MVSVGNQCGLAPAMFLKNQLRPTGAVAAQAPFTLPALETVGAGKIAWLQRWADFSQGA
jgi:hypothetical protein